MDKLIIAKIEMGSNSVITCNTVTVLALYTISDGRLSMHQVSFDSLLYFRDMHRKNLILQKFGRDITPYVLKIGLWFLYSTIPLIALYHCIKFHLFIFNTFRDMLRISLLLQKLDREINL